MSRPAAESDCLPTPLLAALRTATRPLHNALEHHVNGRRLFADVFDAPHYRRFVRTHAAFHRLAAVVTANIADRPAPALLDWPDCDRLDALADDLAALALSDDASVDGHAVALPCTNGFATGFLLRCRRGLPRQLPHTACVAAPRGVPRNGREPFPGTERSHTRRAPGRVWSTCWQPPRNTSTPQRSPARTPDSPSTGDFGTEPAHPHTDPAPAAL